MRSFSQKETDKTKDQELGTLSTKNIDVRRWIADIPPFSSRSFASAIILFLVLLTSTSLCATETPRRPHILRLARTDDPATLDPQQGQTMEDALLWPLLNLPLLDITNRTELVPCAARAWSNSPDQRVFTLWLRPGVRFSNGREVVAADYVYALERYLTPATGAWMLGYLQGIRGAKAFGDGETNHVTGLRAPAADTLIVELERSDPTFPYLLGITAMPHEELERLGPAYSVRPVGTGPYVVQKWVRGAQLQLARNPHYTGPEPQHLDGVDVLIGGDETTHLMMFERGELDLYRPPFPSLRRLTEDPRWRGLWDRETSFGTDNLILNTEVPPLDNVMVRRAINHAINRDLRMHVAQGLYTHATGPIPPMSRGYNPSLRGYDFNPAKARELLAESGLSLPLRTELWHAPGESVTAQGFQWDLDQVGIKVELKPITGSQISPAMQSRGRVPMALWGWTLSIPDPVDMLGSQFDGRSTTNASMVNFAFYNNAEMNRLLDLAAPEVNMPKRYALYQQAEEIIVRDAPWVFLGHKNLVVLRQPWLKGPLVEPLYWFRYDRVWIEE